MNSKVGKAVIVFVMLLSSVAATPSSPASASVTSARQAMQTEVVHWFNTILGRNPDSAGLAYWTDLIATDCVNNAWQASSYFHNSNEAWNRGLTNTQRITYLYQSILHRAPDGAGLVYWVDQLDARGRDAWADVVGSISYSDEARGNVWGRKCRNYQMELMDNIALDYSYNTWVFYAPTNAAGNGNGQNYWPSLRWDNDACSSSFDLAYKESCYRHDFGGRNLRQTDTDFTFAAYSNYQLDYDVWNGYNKSDVDYQFRDDMTAACNLKSGATGTLCRAAIPGYFNAVRTGVEYGWRNMISSDLNEFNWRQ